MPCLSLHSEHKAYLRRFGAISFGVLALLRSAFWRDCSHPECGERNCIESFAEAQCVLARIKHHAGELSPCEILCKPLQMLEVILAERRAGFNLYSKHCAVSAFESLGPGPTEALKNGSFAGLVPESSCPRKLFRPRLRRSSVVGILPSVPSSRGYSRKHTDLSDKQ